MCRAYGLWYSCSHSKMCIMSYCRGTFQSLSTPNMARCLSSNVSLVLRIEQQCRECVYEDFVEEWHWKIQEAEEQLEACSARLHHIDVEDDPWETNSFDDYSRDDDSDAGWADSWEDSPPNVSTLEQAMRQSLSTQQASTSTSHASLTFCTPEVTSLRQERDRLSEVVEALKNAYAKEAWINWHSVEGSTGTSSRKGRKRTVALRTDGGSPLRDVTNMSDLADPEEAFPFESSSNEEASDGESTISISSVPTPRLGAELANADDWTMIPPAIEQPSLKRSPGHGNLFGMTKWIKGVRAMHISDDASIVDVKEEDEELWMPEWSNAFVSKA